MLEVGRDLWGIEVKSARRASSDMLTGLESLAPCTKRLQRKILVCMTDRRARVDDIKVIPIRGVPGRVAVVTAGSERTGRRRAPLKARWSGLRPQRQPGSRGRRRGAAALQSRLRSSAFAGRRGFPGRVRQRSSSARRRQPTCSSQPTPRCDTRELSECSPSRSMRYGGVAVGLLLAGESPRSCGPLSREHTAMASKRKKGSSKASPSKSDKRSRRAPRSTSAKRKGNASSTGSCRSDVRDTIAVLKAAEPVPNTSAFRTPSRVPPRLRDADPHLRGRDSSAGAGCSTTRAEACGGCRRERSGRWSLPSSAFTRSEGYRFHWFYRGSCSRLRAPTSSGTCSLPACARVPAAV